MHAKFYAAYHRAAPLLDVATVCPVHVGRINAAAPLAGMIGDDTGDHMSAQNHSYCELTALYWAWKNDTDASHIGLLHYRRVLDLAGDYQGPQPELFLSRFDIPTWGKATDAWIAANPDVDMVVPKLHLMGMDLVRHYAKRSQPQDLQLTRDIIARDHPDWLDDYDTVMAGRAIRLGNMGLLRRDLMDRYCTWMFDILGKVAAADVDRSQYNPYQSRYLGFLSERLFTVFIHRLQRTEPSLTLREVHILNLSQALVTPYLADDHLNGPEHINVAFAADRTYLPHTAAMLRSMLDHADPARHLNLFFLHTDIEAADLDLLTEVTATRPRTQLHAINAGNPFADSYRSESRAPSNATYNRFLLFDLLPGLDRLLYVDVDMIFREDVAQIFDTDLGDHKLGAVKDYIMTRAATGPTETAHAQIADLGAYHRDVLGLSDDQIRGYINAGLLLFNLAKMDAPQVGRDLIAMAQTGKYLFRDQDILNAYFKDSLLHLPASFNAFNSKLETYERVPQDNFAEAMAGRADPVVIHYAAGDHKPWSGIGMGQAQHYWAALSRTPFLPEVLATNATEGARLQSLQHLRRRRLVNVGRSIADRVPALRGPLLGAYDRLRRMTGR